MLPRARSACVLAWLACAGAAASASAGTRPGEVRRLELYATTDIHGHLEPFAEHLPGGHGRIGMAGGIALLAGAIDNARAAAHGRMILVDGGDLMQGTLASNLEEGATTIRALSLMGYDAVALGNHEFDYGPIGPHPTPLTPDDDPRGALKARMAEATFPVLSANVKPASGKDAFRPYVIREIDGVPVAIIGATTMNLTTTTPKANLVGLRVNPIVPSVIEAAKAAQAAGARVFILAMHAGAECKRALRGFTERDTDDLAGCEADAEGFAVTRGLALAAKDGAPRFSAVVGGHSHQPDAAVVDGIPFVQAGKGGNYLAHVSIEVRGRGAEAAPTGRFTIDPPQAICAYVSKAGHCAASTDPRAVPLDFHGRVHPDARVAQAIAADLATAAAMAARPIGITLPEGMLQHYSAESTLGDFTADALRAATHAEIGVMNGGGLREDLPPGPLTFGSLYETFPFENQIVTLALSGAQLRRTIVHNLHARFGFLSWSGLTAVARCEGGRVLVDITLADGKPLDPAATYRVAAFDFLAAGGDEALAHGKIVGGPSGTVRQAVEDALRKRGGVLHADDPSLFDHAHPRITLPPGGRPVRCGKLESHEEPEAP